MKSGSRTAANLETLYNPIPPPVIYNKGCVTLWPCHIYFFKKVSEGKRRNYYGNLNISPCKNIIFKKSSERRNHNP
jgi:hypothetical protein